LGALNNNYGKKYRDNIYKINESQVLWGTHGYLIKNKNIKKIIDNLVVFDDVIDIKYKKIIDAKKIIGLIINPSLVFQDLQIKSTIKNYNTMLFKSIYLRLLKKK